MKRKLTPGVNDLATLNPELAKEWHQKKNGELTPEQVTVSSNKKVWWQCAKGHEWQAVIGSRSEGASCPYCSNKKILPKYNDLATLNPTLAAEWHPTKNGELTPEQVTLNSGKKVWWQCSKGHEWQAYISNRSNGFGCPYCSGQKAVLGISDLKTVNPKLAKEWHPKKNGELTPEQVTTGSGKKVWWKCAKGHEWQSAVWVRNKGSGCPYCSGRLAIPRETDLTTKCPELVREWHPTKNGNLRPEHVKTFSDKKVWWLCTNGHEWETAVASRTNMKSGCPYCSGRRTLIGFNDLTTVNPRLAKEWHPTKNGELAPEQVTAGSNKKVWWLGKCGHEWQSAVWVRNKGFGCAICARLKNR